MTGTLAVLVISSSYFGGHQVFVFRLDLVHLQAAWAGHLELCRALASKW